VLNDKYKYCGEEKKYIKKEDSFIKFHQSAEEFLREIWAYQFAKRKNILVPKIKWVNWLDLSVVFEYLDLYRLDQIARKFERDGIKIVANFAESSGILIAKLHKSSVIATKPDYSLQCGRLIRLQKDLYDFQNIPYLIFQRMSIKILQKLNYFSGKLSTCSFIHGDFIAQNLFCKNNQKLILFDWENACFSDPMYDLACFLSFFFVIAVKSAFYTMKDVQMVEEKLFSGYEKYITISQFDYERFLFFKFFSHHCMYWYYLLLLKQLGDKYNDKRVYMYLNGRLPNAPFYQMVEDYRNQGFAFKITSLQNIYRLIARSMNRNNLSEIVMPKIQIIK